MPDIRLNARTMRNSLTPVEAVLWTLLRTPPLELWHFRRQAGFGNLYIADFASHSGRLVIEADGPSHQLTQQADTVRTAWFETQAYRVIRFQNSDVVRDRQSVFLTVCALLAESGPPPRSRAASRPPHKGDGGQADTFT